MPSRRLFSVMVSLLGMLEFAVAAEPDALFLTWRTDPCTTMILDWHAEPGSVVPDLRVRERGTVEWQTHAGDPIDFPFSKRKVFRQMLDGLKPSTAYEFQFGEAGKVYYFQTMPETLTRPVVFAIGGDTRHRKDWMVEMNAVAADQGIDFAVLGGDLAYENGQPSKVGNVLEWFDACKETFIRPDGRVLPVLVTIGNHEVRGGYITGTDAQVLRAKLGKSRPEALRSELAPYFYALFASPGQPGYAAIDFGDYLSFLLLDSAHTNPIPGEQTAWLESALADRAGRPNIFPVYHVPAYPSVRKFDGEISAAVREHWLPLFEKAGVKYAFENHDHAYKRTPPIADGKPDPNGIVFLGDGAWGVETRETHPVDETWYLEKAAAVRHGIIVTLKPDGPHFQVLDSKGQQIDAFP